MSRRTLVKPRFFAFTLTLLAVAAWGVNRYRSQAQIISFLTVTVVSAATFEEGPVAPESLAVAFGDAFTENTVTAAATPLPETLGGVRVLIQDSAGKQLPCGLFFVSRRQINFLVPLGLASGNAQITVVTASGVPISGSMQIAGVAPGLIAANANGQGPPAGFLLIVTQSGSQSYEPIARFDQQRKQFVTLPVLLSRINVQAERLFFVLYGTGIHGRTDVRSVTAHLGGVAIPVDFAGSVPNLFGLDQINIPINAGLISALTGRGKLDVALSISTSASERVFSNLLEIEIADRTAGPGLTITGVQPSQALAGETVTISGGGFDPQPNRNRVRVGGIEAQVIEATASQLKIKVPFGAETGPVAVSLGNGEAASPQPLAIRASVSGLVEDTRRRPIIGVTVRALRPGALGLQQTIGSTKTNSEGFFVLPDVPTGEPIYIEIDASTASTTPRLPRLTLAPAIVAGRDNQFTRPIVLQIPTGPGIKIDSSFGFLLEFSLEAPVFQPSFEHDWIQPNTEAPQTAEPAQQTCDGRSGAIAFDLPAGARGFVPCETPEECRETVRTLYVTQVENARTPVKLPAGRYSSMMVQLSPFGSYFTRGGALTIPNADCLTGSPDLRVFRLQPVPTSFGGIGLPGVGIGFGISAYSPQFTEVGTATISADGQRIATTPGAIDSSGIYFVSARYPTATITGRVVEPVGSLPIGLSLVREARRVIVTARGQEAMTDGNGSFILRNIPVLRAGDRVALEVSYARPNGRVERALVADIAINAGGVTAIPAITLTEANANRPPVILASAWVSADENKRTDFNFTVSDADPNQTLQVSMSGPSFAQLINRGGGAYSLRVTPGFDDAGNYTVTLTAADSLGATATHAIALTVANVNQPPTATAQTVVTDEDTTKPITLAGTDPDRNALRFTLVTQPTHGKLTGEAPDLVYLADANYFGSDSFTFKVNDGLADSRPATVSITVNAINDAPWLDVPIEQKVAAGQELKFAVSATDVDAADRVSLTSPDLPAGATFNQVAISPGFAAQFTWTPSASQIGPHIVSFRAGDDGAPAQTVARSIAITVIAANAPESAGKWTATEGPYGGAVLALYANGSNVLAGTSGGLFRSTNAGDAWTRTGVGTIGSAGVSSFAGIGGAIFAGTSAGVFRSSDNGATWVEANQGLRPAEFPFTPGVSALAVKGSLLFAAAGRNVFVSTDDAQNWSRADNGLPLEIIGINKLVTSGASLFASAYSGGIYRTTDDGKNWTEARRGARLETVTELAAFGGTIYAAIAGSFLGGSRGGIFASTDNGTTWSEVQIQPALPFVSSMLITADQFFAGTSDRLYSLIRRAAGQPIQAVPALDKQYIIALASDGATVFAGTASGVFRSTDKGATWKPVNNGLSALTVYSFASAGSNLLAGTSNGVFVGDNQGRNWQPANDGLTSQFLPFLNVTTLAAVTASGATRVFALESFGGFFSSGDLGKSWQRVEGLPELTGVAAMGVSGSALFVSLFNHVLLSPNSITVYRSTDLGKSWSPAGKGLATAIPTTFASLGGNLFAAANDGVFVTANNGESWSAANTGLPEKTPITALAASGSNVYAGTAGKGVYVSTNSGQSWTSANSFLPPNAYVTSLFSAGSNLFAIAADAACPNGSVLIDGQCWGGLTPGLFPIGGGIVFTSFFGGIGFNNGAIYFSPNQGRSWAPVMAGLNDARAMALGATGANVFAGTTGQGVFIRSF
ncbi:MAG: Ig-like domain-containing protein [Blastocatellia bacterium]